MLQSYIDFEINQQNRNNARELYERLLDRTNHVKVWISYASFEAEALPISEEDEEDEAFMQSRQTGNESVSQREAKARRLVDHLISKADVECWELCAGLFGRPSRSEIDRKVLKIW